jgi:hypothetical protein
MNRYLRRCAAAMLGCVLFVPAAYAQDACGCAPTYRIEYKTIYDRQPVTAYRLEYEDQIVDKPITVKREVWETEMRVRKYTVAKPVTLTSEKVEEVKVMRPVWEDAFQDVTYDKVVNETEKRQERYTTMKPVYQENFRDEQYTVRKEVPYTMLQPQQRTVYEPVTTTATQYVDQGGYVDQQTVTPGAVRNRLQWIPGGYSVSGVNGLPYYQRGGFHWVPTQAPAVVSTARVYVPNVVAQQVQQTHMQAKVVTDNVEVQGVRYEDEIQTRRVPYTTLSYQPEEHVREVEVPVQRVVQVVEKRPIRVCKMVEETEVRRTPVVTQRMEYEEHEEQIPVKVLKVVNEEKILRETHRVAKWVAYETTRLTPRTVAMKIPIDQFGNPISSAAVPPSAASDTIVNKQIIDPPAKVRVEKPMSPMPAPMPMPMEDETEKEMETEKSTLPDGTKIVPRDEADKKPMLNEAKKSET